MVSRRNFMFAGSVGLAGFGALTNAQLRADEPEITLVPSAEMTPDRELWEKEGRHLRAGVIGTGWYGKSDMFRILQCGGGKVEIAAICDVDSKVMEEAARLAAERQNGKIPAMYRDYREMLANEKLDVCIVSTPDHWHALPGIAAMEAGCDVYLQKPIGVDVIECAALWKTARRLNRVVQVAMQRRSTQLLIDVKKDFIQSGGLGEVHYVNTYCMSHRRNATILEPETPPESLDFDMWLGPAPKNPYYRISPRGWRSFMEYGNGQIGDMGVHMFDMARWLLDLGWPKRITSNGGKFAFPQSTTTIPDTQCARFDYENLTMEWHHRAWSEVPDRRFYWAAEIFGTKGQLRANSAACDYRTYGGPWKMANTAKEFDRYPSDQTEPGLETNIAGANRAHMWNFLARVIDRGRPVSDIEEGYISAASCILANVSLAMGGASLEWDPENICVKNNPEANKLLAREYRAPWKHPEI